MKIIEKEQASIAHTMQIFLRKATLWLINTSSIPTLLDIVSDASTSRSPTKSPSKSPKKANGTPSKPQEGDAVDSKTIDHSKRILSYISKHCPQLYYPHLPRLVKDIHTNATPASLEAALRALASVAGLGTDQAPSDKYASIYLSNETLILSIFAVALTPLSSNWPLGLIVSTRNLLQDTYLIAEIVQRMQLKS